MNLPPLFHKGKDGALRVWAVDCDGDTVVVRHGLDTGKLAIHTYIACPKNVGRANATTAEEQAAKEAKALWDAKLSRKYSTTRAGASEVLDMLPMLAKKYNAKKVQWPALVQRKYDGNRMMARWEGGKDGAWLFTSRQGREFALPHIAEYLGGLEIEGDVVLDGEIYCHGRPLQEIVSLVKRYRSESETLQYVVYDYICMDDTRSHTNLQRTALLQDTIPESDVLIEGDGAITTSRMPVVHAKTYLAQDLAAATSLQGIFLEQGYEGAILRNPNGLYRFAFRSDDLHKLKVWEDAEFEVVDVIDKKLPGLAIFVCKAPNGKTFEVVRKGPHTQRADDFRNREALIGRRLTVRYAYMTAAGVPFHPTGISIREDWD